MDQLPVPLVIGSSLHGQPGITLSKIQLAPSEWEYLGGLPVATVQRALFDEVVRRRELWAGIEAVAMVAAARLISVRLFARYVLHRKAWEGVPLVRKVIDHSRDDLRSPREVWLHLVWELVAELPRAFGNVPIFNTAGELIGVPDLFDPISGTVGEYDGEHHRAIEQHRSDVAREGRFRDHGLEYFTAVRGDDRGTVASRMVRTRARAKFLPPESCAWTLDPPPWYSVPETLDEYFERAGMVQSLVHR